MPDDLAALRAAVDRFPAEVTAALQAVAKASADRIAKNAATILRSKTHGTGATAKSIRVIDDSPNKTYRVEVPGGPIPTLSLHRMKRSGRTHTQKVTQNNLPFWLERGTKHMAARPFLRPAADAEQDRYKAAMAAAAEAVGVKLLGRFA